MTPNFFRACIDLLEDTQVAIQEYQNHGLGSSDRLGEKYIRLYGLLNAVYQQIQAIGEMSELFNISGKKLILQNMRKLEIYQLRNKLAAHSINYHDPSKKLNRQNLDFIRLNQSSISNLNEHLTIHSNKGGIETIDLRNCILEYSQFTDTILLRICNKAIPSIFPNDCQGREWLLTKVEFVKVRIENHSKEM